MICGWLGLVCEEGLRFVGRSASRLRCVANAAALLRQTDKQKREKRKQARTAKDSRLGGEKKERERETER